ncbi:hypothetical protein TNCV_4736481 [Trichonephila clavipes]|nr:hypothetical protein TNCV_4736481 [Trichonephila clavipes]
MPQNLLEHVSASYLLLRLVGYQSSWRSTEDFQYTASPPWKVALFSFLAPTAWRLTGSAIWRRGSVTTYWDRPLVGLGVKRREEFGRRISSSVPTSSSSVGGFGSCQRQPFSLGSSALHVRTSAVETNTGLLSAVLHTSVFLVQVGISEQELCISWLQRRMLVVV